MGEYKIMCKYAGCDEQPNTPYDDEYCIFHAKKDKKGISGEEFNKKIIKKIERQDYNFEGYIFPGGISFEGMEFNEKVNFIYAKFQGNLGKIIKDKKGRLFNYDDLCVNFKDVEFKSGVIFRDAEFSGGNTYFGETKFSGENVIFDNAIFSGGEVYFTNSEFASIRTIFRETKFSGGNADFKNVKFTGGNVFFIDTEFSGGKADFMSAKFSGGNVNFTNTKFTGGDVNFIITEFSNNVIFYKIVIKNNLYFSEIILSDKSTFYFKNPEFMESEKNIILKFSDISFNPFLTYFENINYPEKHKSNGEFIDIVVIFRYCQLKDVYFSDSDMSLFSFYKSIFEEAKYYSCLWKEEKRIFEERIYSYVNSLKVEEEKTKIKKIYEIEDLNYNEIAALYRRFKTLLDKSKDYTEAGGFYFKEFEMKRKALFIALKDELENKKWLNSFRNGVLYLLYLIYNIFAGYGEKPGRSFWSFLGFWLFFSWLHLLSGLEVIGYKTINYDISLSWYGLKNILNIPLKDVGYALGFALYRVIPISYLPYQGSGITPEGIGGLFLSFANTFVLILFVIFIGIGLKRHFRRF